MSDLSILPFAFFFVGVLLRGAGSFSFFSSFTLTIGLARPVCRNNRLTSISRTMGDFLVECQRLPFRSKHESNGASLYGQQTFSHLSRNNSHPLAKYERKVYPDYIQSPLVIRDPR
jgi:hypothetical protein